MAGTTFVTVVWVAGIVSTIVYLETAHGETVRGVHPLVLSFLIIGLWPLVLVGFIAKQLWSP
jgi:hypothetical protein